MASYVSISYKLKEFWRDASNLFVELLITFILILLIGVSDSKEFLVWTLVGLVALQQIIQLYMEVQARLSRQHLDRIDEVKRKR